MRPNTKLVWLETPSNPMLKIFDIAAIAEVAQKTGASLAVDNTFATPMLQRPLDLGATMVVHSTTKYLNGHSDVVGGARHDERRRARASGSTSSRSRSAAVPSPFDCYMVLRGLKTLAVRMRAARAERASRRAGSRRTRKSSASSIPGLETHPGARAREATDEGPRRR